MLKTTSRLLNKVPALRVERGNTVIVEFSTYQYDSEDEEWDLVAPDTISLSLYRRGGEVQTGFSYLEDTTGVYQVAVRLVTVGEYTLLFSWSLGAETTAASKALECVLHIDKALKEVEA